MQELIRKANQQAAEQEAQLKKKKEAEKANAPPKPEPKEFTADEVKAHNKPGDSWIILDGKVYDVSEYMHEHPGGKEQIEPCIGTGKDH